MVKPKHIFAFLISVFTVLIVLTFVFPEDGVKIGKLELKFPKFKNIINPENVEYADINKIVKKQLEIDSSSLKADTTAIEDTVKADEELLAASEYPLEMSTAGKEKLQNFFSEMESSVSSDKPVRILHFGDSQIEADHITSFFRERLQQGFGGAGQGWLGIKPVTQKLSWRVFPDDNWKRYTLYGTEDTTITHKRFGPGLTIFRYAPVVNDSVFNDTVIDVASFRLKNTYQGYSKCNSWSVAKLYYGNLHSKVSLEVRDKDDAIVLTDTLSPVEGISSVHLAESYMDEFTVKLKGYDSPDVYGVSLESSNGIVVDNLPLRGNAGTVFTSMDYTQMTKWLKILNTKLVVMQFGVNVVNEETENFSYYKSWIKSQLRTVNSMNPNLPVIVISVSDMSKKEGTKYVSYEAVEKIRNIQKEAALENGAIFWDMYEAMGGENSMPSWVWADPPLANKDFTHFNVRGSRLIGNMFYNALLLEYHNYRKAKSDGESEEKEDDE